MHSAEILILFPGATGDVAPDNHLERERLQLPNMNSSIFYFLEQRLFYEVNDTLRKVGWEKMCMQAIAKRVLQDLGPVKGE